MYGGDKDAAGSVMAVNGVVHNITQIVCIILYGWLGVRIGKRNALFVSLAAIAIVGLSGRYPQARNVDEFWRNLREGKDCIVEIPQERWDWRDYYSDDRTAKGRHYSKWGGFIEGVDEFRVTRSTFGLDLASIQPLLEAQSGGIPGLSNLPTTAQELLR